MIAIVDYGSGNVQAIANIYRRLDIQTFLATSPPDLECADRIILPGVGAFDQAMSHLNESGLRATLNKRVLEDEVPLLGICVGMQLLARRSDEGSLPGLGWIDADVRRFDDSLFAQRTRLPHMGWNDIERRREHALLGALDEQCGFYFLHSFYVACDRPQDVLAETEYGLRFHAAVQVRNVLGVQFHPEKSHHNGVQLLKNFALM